MIDMARCFLVHVANNTPNLSETYNAINVEQVRAEKRYVRQIKTIAFQYSRSIGKRKLGEAEEV